MLRLKWLVKSIHECFGPWFRHKTAVCAASGSISGSTHKDSINIALSKINHEFIRTASSQCCC